MKKLAEAILEFCNLSGRILTWIKQAHKWILYTEKRLKKIEKKCDIKTEGFGPTPDPPDPGDS